ncbi:MAG: hypothetical protein IJS99_10705 [Synergistaceae bacterium]|nr:hypothetical protein [Synergistaceae bacterium]
MQKFIAKRAGFYEKFFNDSLIQCVKFFIIYRERVRVKILLLPNDSPIKCEKSFCALFPKKSA